MEVAERSGHFRACHATVILSDRSVILYSTIFYGLYISICSLCIQWTTVHKTPCPCWTRQPWDSVFHSHIHFTTLAHLHHPTFISARIFLQNFHRFCSVWFFFLLPLPLRPIPHRFFTFRFFFIWGRQIVGICYIYIFASIPIWNSKARYYTIYTRAALCSGPDSPRSTCKRQPVNQPEYSFDSTLSSDNIGRLINWGL